MAETTKVEGDVAEAAPQSSPLLSKTEKRRLCKLKKKALMIENKKKTKKIKVKLTKEERREKYTSAARIKRASKLDKKRFADVACFFCRQTGHSVANCKEASVAQLCYKCGSTEHRLKDCPKQQQQRRSTEENLPFARCFLCHQVGHIASQCSKNSHGIYVMTGSGGCRECGSFQHLAVNCPDKQQQRQRKNTNNTTNMDRDDDDSSRSSVGMQQSNKSKDLTGNEDDAFLSDEEKCSPSRQSAVDGSDKRKPKIVRI